MSVEAPEAAQRTSVEGGLSRKRQYLSLTVLVALVVGLGIWWLWPKSRPSAFFGGLALEGPAVVGEPIYISPAVSARRAVTVTAVKPVFARGSAPAVIFVLSCDPTSGEGIVNSLDLCGHPAVFDQLVLKPSDAGALTVGVIPLATGDVRITGFEVGYRDGGNRDVTIGTKVTLRTSRVGS